MKILNAAKNYEHLVGTNPDIFVEGEKIFLKGVDEFKNSKPFETILKASDYFK